MDQSDKVLYQVSGVKWLYQYELVYDPQLINHLKMNILMISNRIKEVELLFFTPKKQLLIYLELDWIGTKFYVEQRNEEVTSIVKDLLPSYNIRVITDIAILEASKELLKANIGAQISE
jgi:hypothetical protein